MRSGYSLLDLTVALGLMGMGASILVPSARRHVDRNAVLAAREAVIAELARARRESRLSGGAVLQLRRAGSLLWIEAADLPRDTLALEERYGVRMDPGATSAAVAFDALGIGRLANRTLTFTRRDASARVVVSAYGRVRRQ
jgi:type II secretory pathway pseudopilin PulG